MWRSVRLWRRSISCPLSYDGLAIGVLTREPREDEWSDAMRHTPRQRHYAYALRGFWTCFPVSPASYAARLASQFTTRRWFSENQSFGLARKLDTFLDEVASVIQQDQYAQALFYAMLRAFLTVVIELMEVADDSFGCLGASFRNGFAKYLAMPRVETGMDATVFFDLLATDLEDYGLTYDQTEGYFAGLTPDEGDLCIAYVQQQMQALQADDLDYHYEEALTLLGQIVAEQQRLNGSKR